MAEGDHCRVEVSRESGGDLANEHVFALLRYE